MFSQIRSTIHRLVRPGVVVNANKVHFLHIGKTGGTAIRDVLKKQESIQDFEVVLHQHRTRLDDVPPGEKACFFLRDPLSRFISGFYSRKRKGQPRYHFEWNDKERALFTTFETPNELALALADEESPEHELARASMGTLQHTEHFSKWLVSMEYLESRIDDLFFIGFQESLDEDFERLKKKLGLGDEVRLPTDDVVAHKSPPGLDTSLDAKARECLEAWYREDLELLERCKALALHL